MAIEITTNNVPRDIIDAWELSESERARFDYLDWDAILKGEDSASFFRYRGDLYELGEFTRVEDTQTTMAGWDGYMANTYFSAILVKYFIDTDNYDETRIIVGQYYAG